MRQNVDQNNSEYGHFSRSAYFLVLFQSIPIPILANMVCQNKINQLLNYFLYHIFFSFFKSLHNNWVATAERSAHISCILCPRSLGADTSQHKSSNCTNLQTSTFRLLSLAIFSTWLSDISKHAK